MFDVGRRMGNTQSSRDDAMRYQNRGLGYPFQTNDIVKGCVTPPLNVATIRQWPLSNCWPYFFPLPCIHFAQKTRAKLNRACKRIMHNQMLNAYILHRRLCWSSCFIFIRKHGQICDIRSFEFMLISLQNIGTSSRQGRVHEGQEALRRR